MTTSTRLPTIEQLALWSTLHAAARGRKWHREGRTVWAGDWRTDGSQELVCTYAVDGLGDMDAPPLGTEATLTFIAEAHEAMPVLISGMGGALVAVGKAMALARLVYDRDKPQAIEEDQGDGSKVFDGYVCNGCGAMVDSNEDVTISDVNVLVVGHEEGCTWFAARNFILEDGAEIDNYQKLAKLYTENELMVREALPHLDVRALAPHFADAIKLLIEHRDGLRERVRQLEADDNEVTKQLADAAEHWEKLIASAGNVCTYCRKPFSVDEMKVHVRECADSPLAAEVKDLRAMLDKAKDAIESLAYGEDGQGELVAQIEAMLGGGGGRPG